MASIKKCKGSGKTQGFGCGEPLFFTERNGLKTYRSKFGICPTCQWEWGKTNEEGKQWFSKKLELQKNKAEKEKKKEFRKKKSDLNVKGAMQSADNYFSRYIRLYYSKDGFCTCYTCGTDTPIKELDNGHYQKREHKATRYHENNCRPQCKTCNGDVKHNGKQDEFRVNLVNEIGEKEVVEVETLARSIFKVNTKFFRDTSDYYRLKLNELQKTLKVKIW
jgi:hypothetical protein